ncbi:MAG: Crp/Fnr family transcriptional regulator [Gemmatimonadota bacterium]
MALTRGIQLDEARALLRALPALSGLGDEALDRLARIARFHDYPKGNILHYQGDADGAVFLLIEGKVKILLMNEEGREVVVDLVLPGVFFGLVSAVEGGSHPAHAITLTAARLARIQQGAFRKWLDAEPTAERIVLEQLAARLRAAYQRIGEHALLGVKERLMSVLLEIAGREGRQAPDGDDMLFTRPTHQELAERIGSSREVVTRVLKDLLEDDLLSADGRVIRVPLSALVLRD